VSDGAEVRFTGRLPKIGGEDWEGPPADGSANCRMAP